MKTQAELFVDCRCELGEGPFWNPFVQRIFWFDILDQTLFSANPNGKLVDRFAFKEPVSAAAIVDEDHLVVASASGLLLFELSTDTSRMLAPFEAEKHTNRSNDGRMNMAGGFWIGTMSRRGEHEPGAGSLYQFRAGKLEALRHNITIPNSICFSPDGQTAYMADTPTKTIQKCSIDPETGRPIGEWLDFISTEGHRGYPDGAVIDAEGYIWGARWGGSCVVRHAPDGTVDKVVELPVSRVSCPAFGGPELKTLYITTARETLTPEELEAEPLAGSLFCVETDVPGLPSPFLTL